MGQQRSGHGAGRDMPGPGPSTPDPPGLWAFDEAVGREGYTLLAGVDEAGRGPLAGPVVAAAVVLPPGARLAGVRDSKELPPPLREELARTIRATALAVGIGVATSAEVDRFNIWGATCRAMQRAVQALPLTPHLCLVDGGLLPPLPVPCRAVVGGDRLSQVIAAASVVAKVTRDRIMDHLDRHFPQYGLARHKGYLTPDHRQALLRYGPSPVHRQSYRLPGAERLDTGALGRAAEAAAVQWLTGRGYTIVARKVRTPRGELDVVATDGRYLIFVEVRSGRGGVAHDSAESVGPRKRRRLVEAARAFVAGGLGGPELDGRPARFDVLVVRVGPGGQVIGVRHLEDAFSA